MERTIQDSAEVPGRFYVNTALEKLMFDELRTPRSGEREWFETAIQVTEPTMHFESKRPENYINGLAFSSLAIARSSNARASHFSSLAIARSSKCDYSRSLIIWVPELGTCSTPRTREGRVDGRPSLAVGPWSHIRDDPRICVASAGPTFSMSVFPFAHASNLYCLELIRK